MNTLLPGTPIIYVDPAGLPHHALSTVIWGGLGKINPVINLVFVKVGPEPWDGTVQTNDTSVSHASNTDAPGRYWCRPEELASSLEGRALANLPEAPVFEVVVAELAPIVPEELTVETPRPETVEIPSIVPDPELPFMPGE